MATIDLDMIGKTMDWIGAFGDAAGKQLGHDEKQEAAELAARIFVAVASKIFGVIVPTMRGMAPSHELGFDHAVDHLVTLAIAQRDGVGG